MAKLGTELKMNVHLEPIDGYHMVDYDFNVDFYVFTNRRLRITKEEMIRSDDDNYIALVDTKKVGCGELKADITAYIPDSDFSDNYRKEVLTVETNETIE